MHFPWRALRNYPTAAAKHEKETATIASMSFELFGAAGMADMKEEVRRVIIVRACGVD